MNKTQPELALQIVDAYLSGKTSTEISRCFRVSIPTVFNCLRRHGKKPRTVSESKRKYSLDETYFNVIDSHDKAQILGMVGADGNVADKRPVFEITLQRGDEPYLEEIKKRLNYTGPLYRLHNKKLKTNYSRLSITSQVLTGSMKNLGIIPRKSLVLTFPSRTIVPDQFINSYILGFYEGDGGIAVHKDREHVKSRISFTGSRLFLETLKQVIKDKANVNSQLITVKKNQKHHSQIYVLTLNGNQQVMRLCRWMYEGSSFNLTRKYEKYQYLVTHFNPDGTPIKTEGWSKIMGEKAKMTRIKNQTRPGRQSKYDVYLSSENGTIYHIKWIKSFVKEMGLSGIAVYRLIQGRWKAGKYRGWTMATSQQISEAEANGTIIRKFY